MRTARASKSMTGAKYDGQASRETVRCQACPGHVRVEVEDLGGVWQPGQPDSRPHGLDIIVALTGPDGWGTRTTGQGNRVVWARLDQ